MGLIGNFSLLANELVNIYYNENHPLVSTETGRTWNKRPLTFGRWLEKNKKTAQSVLDDAFLLNRVSRDLLMDIGIPHPSQHQLHETRFALSVAVKKDKFEDFTSPTIQGVLDVEFGSDCCSGNVFFEREAYGSRALTSEALKLSKRNKYRLKTGYADGCLGQVVAATFISGSNRSSSDFSHAYGDEPWACYLQAWNMLDQIPQGQFVENLDIDMITKTNKLIHAPDPRGGSIFYRAVGAVTRGRLDVAGRIREGRTLSQMYTFTHEEIKNLTELGISFYGLPSLGSSTQSGIMEYPAPTVIRGRMQELIDELKEELAKEDADVIGLAAKFCRELVAIHPYEDSNGRMARVLMNRIRNHPTK